MRQINCKEIRTSYHYRNNYIKSDNNARASNQTILENNTIPSATASNFDNEETRRGFLSRHTKKRSIIDDETSTAPSDG